MLQPPANKILFEVFLNWCQGLNDSQEHKYVYFSRGRTFESTCTCVYSLFMSVHTLYINVSGVERDTRGGNKGCVNEKKKVSWAATVIIITLGGWE